MDEPAETNYDTALEGHTLTNWQNWRNTAPLKGINCILEEDSKANAWKKLLQHENVIT